jgi:hypothetical protein
MSHPTIRICIDFAAPMYRATPGANHDGTLIAFACDTNDVRSNLTTVTAPEAGNIGGIFVYRDP